MGYTVINTEAVALMKSFRDMKVRLVIEML